MVEKKQDTEERYEKAQVPESMRDVILDKKTDKVISDLDILLEILNKVEKIERSVA